MIRRLALIGSLAVAPVEAAPAEDSPPPEEVEAQVTEEAPAEDDAPTEEAAPEEAGAEKAVPERDPARKRSRKQELAERKKYALQPRTAKIFAEARAHIGAERYDEASAELRKLRLRRLSPHERAQTHRLFGYVAYGKQDNQAATLSLQASLAENGLSEVDRSDVLFQIAQIQAVEKRWGDVIGTLQTWFQSVERPNSVGYYLLALSYFQLEDLESALAPARTAVEIAEVPQQAWIQLLLAIHLTRKDYRAATPIALQLVSHYPNSGREPWLQLSALYASQGDNDRALAVLELARHKGLLAEDRDLRRLLQLTLFQGIPVRAARILEQELAAKRIQEDAAAFELLASSWMLAREPERAEGPLARAAGLETEGDLYVRLAQVHLMQEEWDAAAAALRRALERGGARDPGSVQLLLGIASYNGNKLEEARGWFTRAQRSEASRQQAQSWLDQIDRDLEKERSPAMGG